MAKKNQDKGQAEPAPQEPTQPALPLPAPVEPAAIPLRWVRVSHHSPDHIAPRYLYAAYGSNLNLGQMATRCQGADIVGSGVLRNARLVFARYLGIVEDDDSTVPVGVFRLTAADVAALDRYEGLGRSYERFLVTVEMNGEAVRCFTYIKRNNEPEQPSDKYWTACSQGYADWNMDARRLRHAREFARKNEKPKRYGSGYGTANGMDWRDYQRTGLDSANVTRMVFNPVTRRMERDASIPPVPTIDGDGKPYVSFVTGRTITPPPRPRQTADQWDKNHPRPKGRLANSNYKAGDEITASNGERWVMGANGVWLRKEA